jgi:hypothetical protein
MDYTKAIDRLKNLIHFLQKERLLENQLSSAITKEEQTSILVRLKQYRLVFADYSQYEISNGLLLLEEYINKEQLLLNLRLTKKTFKMYDKYSVNQTNNNVVKKEEELNIFIVSIILYLQGGYGVIDYKNDLSELILNLYIIADKDKKREALNNNKNIIKDK